MIALKEFANFIYLNVANLATTYERLLAERDEAYKTLPTDTRTALARRLIKAIAEACEAGISDPFHQLFDIPNRGTHLLGDNQPPQPLLEIECLSQTLTPVVTNLEAGKFLWQMLSEARAPILLSSANASTASTGHSDSYSAGDKATKKKPRRDDNANNLLQEVTSEKYLLRALIDHLPDIIYAKDTESRFILANIGVTRHMGAMTPEELIGKTDFDFFPKTLAEQYYADEQQLINSGRSLLNKEEPTIDAAGNRRWLSTSKVLLRDSQGNITGFVGIGRDITEHKQLEQQIQESLEHRTRQVQTSTAVAQQIGKATALDELFHRLVNLVQAQFGYYYVQVYTLVEDNLVLQEGSGELGRLMKEADHKITLATKKSLVVRAFQEGQPVLTPDVSQESTWLPNPLLPKTKAELAVPISLRGEVLGVLDIQSDTVGGLNEEDQLMLIGLCGQIAMAADHHRIEVKRRQTEEKLVEEHNLLRALVDNLPEQIYVKDAKNRFLLVNQPVANNLGVATPEEAIGKTDFDFFPPEEAQKYYDIEQAIIRSGQPKIAYESSKFDSKIGATEWTLATKAPFRDSQGRVIGLVGLNRDITPLKQSQENLAKMLAETEILYQASAALNLAQTYEDILEALRHYTIMGQGAQNISLNYFDRPWVEDNQPPTWILALARYSELPPEKVSSRYLASSFSSIRQIIRGDRPTIFEDVKNDPRMDDNARQLYINRFGAKSTIFVPMIVRGQWVGYINAIYQQPTIFPESEVRHLTLLVGQAAVSVQAIQQLKRSERRTQRERLLREVGANMAKSLHPETIIQIGLAAIGQELDQPGITIQLASEIE